MEIGKWKTKKNLQILEQIWFSVFLLFHFPLLILDLVLIASSPSLLNQNHPNLSQFFG